jgi:GTP-binding protein HflX
VVIGNLPFLLTDTVGFIRKLPHGLVESFKSTLDEVRESDLLIHVVDISHPTFEEQIQVVQETLQEIGTADKPVFMIFNKVDAYFFVQKDEFDLTPLVKENRSLDDLKNTWMSKANAPSLFISATQKINIQEFRDLIYEEVKRLHIIRYPYNNLLY